MRKILSVAMATRPTTTFRRPIIPFVPISFLCMTHPAMNDLNPITQWLERARRGDDDAAAQLWRHYFARVTRLARGRMAAMSRAVYDEEDAALSAMHSFFRGMHEERFPQLTDRHNLWRLLSIITARKVHHRRRAVGALKRGADADGAVAEPAGDWELLNIIDHEPTPDFVAEMLDALQTRIDLLPDATLRRIALLTLDGFTQIEIAKQLSCTVRTIHRKLEAIRSVWEEADFNAGSVRSAGED